jgi:hypothetical protein
VPPWLYKQNQKPLKILPVLYGGSIDSNLARVDFWEFGSCAQLKPHMRPSFSKWPPHSQSLVLTLHKISKEISSVFSLNLSLSPELFMTKYCGQKKGLHGKSTVHYFWPGLIAPSYEHLTYLGGKKKKKRRRRRSKDKENSSQRTWT